MTTSIREWRNIKNDRHYTDQDELQRMTKTILAHADKVENKPTPGYSRQNISRVIIAESSMIPGTTYIIHVDGFTVTDIVEMVRS